MISKETARKIHNAHYEIEKSKELIERLKNEINKNGDLKLKDAFGDYKGLQLGVPSSSGSSVSLYNIPNEIAFDVIEAHIKNQERILIELQGIAKIELA